MHNPKLHFSLKNPLTPNTVSHPGWPSGVPPARPAFPQRAEAEKACEKILLPADTTGTSASRCCPNSFHDPVGNLNGFPSHNVFGRRRRPGGCPGRPGP